MLVQYLALHSCAAIAFADTNRLGWVLEDSITSASPLLPLEILQERDTNSASGPEIPPS